jgi:hypothetical protein
MQIYKINFKRFQKKKMSFPILFVRLNKKNISNDASIANRIVAQILLMSVLQGEPSFIKILKRAINIVAPKQQKYKNVILGSLFFAAANLIV